MWAAADKKCDWGWEWGLGDNKLHKMLASEEKRGSKRRRRRSKRASEGGREIEKLLAGSD